MKIQRLEKAIAELEAQRGVLSEEVINASIAALRKQLTDLGPPEQQRKLVTILYADIVGSTNIVKHLDPEVALEIMDGSLKRLAIPVEEHGGHVARFTGDGFKAVFGMPKAHENDPEMAIRAGLVILEAAQELGGELEEERSIHDFQVRVGINTGLAALGGMTEAEDTVMGSTVNLTKRVESAAPPGGLLITHNTYRHVRGNFTVREHQPIEAKGFDEPVQVYRVLAVKPRAFRVQTRGVEGVETRMVGRKAELNALQEIYRNAIEGAQIQVVTVVGEAGVGKSRLLYEFDNWIELLPDEVCFFQGRGRQETQYLPYALLKDVFTFRFQIQESDSTREVRKKLESGFGEIFGIGDEGQMRTHITGQLLGIDFSESQHVIGILDDPQQIRDRALMYMAEYFQGMSERLPVVIFLEDIHWADDSSLDMVNRLVRRLKNQRLLFVCLARYRLFDRYQDWGEELPQHTQIELTPLSQEDSHELVLEILKLAEQVPVDLRELIVSNAEGNPFYVEELIKMLIEDGIITTGEEIWGFKTDNLDEIIVPATLTSVLQARLDSLPSAERKTLQQASVVGRTFWDRIVECIHASDSAEADYEGVSNALSALQNREMIYRQMISVFDDAKEYLFKHAVLREVTYESVLLRLRRIYHGLVAEWLIEHSGDRTSEYSGLIADHLELAGKDTQAAIYLYQAGAQALRSFANKEAENYFRRSLKITFSEEDRSKILMQLGEALFNQSRYKEAIQIWREGIGLFKELGNLDSVARLYARSARAAGFHAGDPPGGLALCQEGLEVIHNAPQGPGVALLLHEAGRAYYFNGMPDEALPLCQQALQMAEILRAVDVQADTLTTLGIMPNQPIEDALGSLTRAVEIAEASNLLEIASRAHYNLGNENCIVVGDQREERYHYLRAAELSRKRGAVKEELYYLVQAALVSISLGEIAEVEETLPVLESMLSTISESGPAQRGVRDLKSELLVAQGMFTQALQLERVSQEESRQWGDLAGLYGSNISLAFILLEQYRLQGIDSLSEAETVLTEAIEAAEIVGEKHWISCLLSMVYTFQGRFQEARRLLVEAKEAIKPPAFRDEVTLARAEAQLAVAEERWGDTFSNYETAVGILVKQGICMERAQVLREWAAAHVARGEPADYERAKALYQEALAMFQEMGNTYYANFVEEQILRLEQSSV
jgi:class 3 adenylate cyclase/tetratricopeptide (TPR) repeat protein